jgi:hypothetical protein
MKKILAASAVAAALTLAPFAAAAQEQAGNTALGALSGAVVFGPVGAVAGAVVGYAMGPSIARALGPNRSKPPQRIKTTRSLAEQKGRATAARPPASVRSAGKQAADPVPPAPPVRAAAKQAAEPVPPSPAKPAVQPAAQSLGDRDAMPPAQSFD